MELTPRRRLPGVTFRTEVPPSPDVLPRMDVAGFVGLAARGPIGVPVPVEDPALARDLFGAALPLAWDAAAGHRAQAFLAPAVAAFFRNGGKRAWVVRTARDATVSRFPVPTLLDAVTGLPARVHARSAGSWADGLRVGTVLDARTLVADPPAPDGDGFALVTRDAEPLRSGDVLRVTYHADDQETELLLPVRSVREGAGVRRVRTGPGRAFQRRPPSGEGDLPVEAALVPDEGVPTTTDITGARLFFADGAYSLRYDPALGPDVTTGQVLHVVVTAGPDALRTLWLAAGDVERVGQADPSQERVVVHAADARWPLEENLGALVAGLGGARVTVEKLSFDLIAWDGEETCARLPGLALARSEAAAGSAERRAARFWGDLPTDEHLFRHEDGRPVDSSSDLDRAVRTPRFPLAAPPEVAALALPLGMPAAPTREASRGALEADAATTLERDGLAGFTPTWFLDDELAGVGLHALPAAVFDLLYLRGATLNEVRADAPPAGIHALWTLDEVTLLAAPDAVQPGWVQRASPVPAPLDAPGTPTATPLDAPGGFRLDWPGEVVGEVEFELQEAGDPLFGRSTVVYRGPQTHTYVYFGVEGPCGVDLGCAVPRYYRLRLRSGGQVGPWSGTLFLDAEPEGFRACRGPLGAPTLSLVGVGDSAELSWTAVEGADRYVVEASLDAPFTVPEVIATTDDLDHTILAPPQRTTYYRVRAERDTGASPATESGPWSATVLWAAAPIARWTMRTPADFDADPDAAGDLLAFHRCALRFAAARADVTAILALPAHYRTEQSAAHAGALTPDPDDDADAFFAGSGAGWPLGLGEEGALSYGALYHPWIGVRDEAVRGQPVRFLPPDGAMAGVVAARANERGAWVAPANVTLRDVVALAPPFDEAAWARLAGVNVNLVRPLPRGFAPLGADTLADGLLRPLNVRRLMILLRRLALREGHRFAFDSNSATLRRHVEVRFE
ncbi:MAG TPA: hypothetical protein VK610_01555, partial [Rhodothermales bacterium]|nr:hypothetical protein [Rhodothermales bacterium]